MFTRKKIVSAQPFNSNIAKIFFIPKCSSQNATGHRMQRWEQQQFGSRGSFLSLTKRAFFAG